MLRRESRKGQVPRGFSLLELAVVAVLSSILILILMRWVTGIAGAAASGQEIDGVQRAVSAVDTTFRSDTERAGVCDPYGLGSALAFIHTDSVGMYVDDNSDGKMDLVVWKVENSTLLRGVSTGSGSCSIALPTTYAVVAEKVQSATFAGTAAGTAHTQSSDYGDCTGMPSLTKPGAEGCLYDGVHLHVALMSPTTSGVPAQVDETYPLDESGSRLGRSS